MSRLNKTESERVYAQLEAVGVHPAALAKFDLAVAVSPADATQLRVDGRDIYISGPIVSDANAEFLAARGVRSASPGTVHDAIGRVGADERIRLRINSPGGDVFPTAAIKSMLDERGYDARVDGLAGSAAGMLAINADHVEIAEMGMLMLHRAYTGVVGNAANLEKAAGVLRSIDDVQAQIMGRRGIRNDHAMQMLDAETWLAAQPAVESGLADAVVMPPEPAAENGDKAAAIEEVAAMANEYRARMRARAINGG